MAEHWKSRHGQHHHAYTEVFISPSELGYSSIFIRVIHEVDIPLEDFSIKLQGVLDQIPVISIILFFQHVHERTVIDTMHSQRSDKIPLKHPECFSQQQGVRDFPLNPVNHFAPELLRNRGIEFSHAHCTGRS